jgi:predicted NBD/HSP70 family sugar kinase/predicted transcriptional regulator
MNIPKLMNQNVVLKPGSQTALRSANQQRIVDVLQASGQLSQARLARETGLAPATVSNIVRELVTKKVLTTASAGGKRRAVRLAQNAGLVAGIDYGHRHLTVAIADMGHNILSELRAELGPGISANEGIETAANLLGQALESIGERMEAVTAIGMGLPAPIDSHTGKVAGPSILPGWVGIDPSALASERLGQLVVVDNDANLGVLAEHAWGAAAGVDNVAYLKLSEGVGAGLILGGQLFRGPGGTAGEIGHTTVDDFGPVCRCGNRGCLETIVAARSVIDLLEPRYGPGLSIADIVRMANAGDHACSRILSDTGRHVGVAVANLCNLFNPDLIVIGGELAQADELLLAPIREMVRRCGIPSAAARMEIRRSELAERSHVLGAVALALLEATPHMAS